MIGVHSKIAIVFLTLVAPVFSDDESEIRKLVSTNLQAGSKIPVAAIQGSVEVENGEYEDFRYFKSGNKFLFEGDKFSLKKDVRQQEVNSLKKWKQLLGVHESSWLLFTGSRVAQYQSMELTLLVQNTTDAPAFSHVRYLDPKQWGRIGPLPIELVLSQMKFSTTEDGAMFSFHGGPETKQMAYSDMEVEVSKHVGWNVTKVKFWGGVGSTHENVYEWKQQDNHWYPYKGTAKVGKDISAKWEIKHISFSPSDLKTDFKIHEERLSGIMKYEGAPGTKQVQTILGGPEGERQYRLLKAEQFLE